jgi:hypothetical protein
VGKKRPWDEREQCSYHFGGVPGGAPFGTLGTGPGLVPDPRWAERAMSLAMNRASLSNMANPSGCGRGVGILGEWGEFLYLASAGAAL